jgi:hypothetical protein
MNKQRFLEILNNRDLPGVGCVVQYKDGCKDYTFYEDFSTDDPGIKRAERTYTDLINKGYVSRVDYIYKDSKSIHFWDWNTKSGSFCASDEYRRFCKSNNIKLFSDWCFNYIAVINGLNYKLDYTPAIDGISAITITRSEDTRPLYTK